MERGKEMLLARRDARPKVSQRELEILLELPSGTIAAIEWGRITVTDAEYDRILAAIDEISARKKEALACNESERQATLAST